MSKDGSAKQPLLPEGGAHQGYGGTEVVSSFENDFCHFESNDFYNAYYVNGRSYSISFLFERLSKVELEDCRKEMNMEVLKQKLSFLAVRIQPTWRVGEDRDPSQRAKAQNLLSNIITMLQDKLSLTVGKSKAPTGTKVGSSSSVDDVPDGSSAGESKSESDEASSVSPDGTQFTVVQCLLHAYKLQQKLDFSLKVCAEHIDEWSRLDRKLRSKKYRRFLFEDMQKIKAYLEQHEGKGLDDDAQRKYVFDLSEKLTKVDKHLSYCDQFLKEAQNYHTDEVAIYQKKKEQLNQLMRDLRELHYQEEAFIKFSAAEKASTAAAICCTVPLCAASSALVCMAGVFALSTGIGDECNGAGAGCRLMCCFACSGDGLRPDDSSSTCCGSGKPYRNACGVLGSLCSSPSDDKVATARAEATTSVEQLTMA